MPLDGQAAVKLADELLSLRAQERDRLDTLHAYVAGPSRLERLVARHVDRLPSLPAGTPKAVQRLARISRVNLLRYVVSARVQNLFVDGFQTPDAPDNLAVWDAWQRNQLDARQIGVHRAALKYGAAYAVVLPGEPVPVVRGASPRQLTAGYGDDDEWPTAALEKRRGGLWRLLDAEAVYTLRGEDDAGSKLSFVGVEEHGATWDGEPVTPVVRFRDTDDLDDPVSGIVEPLLDLQDQVNITTFGLQVAQHYGAFRQRYIIGWLASSEQEAVKTSASKLMMFEDAPDDVKIGEFSQTDLRGYIESREATVRHLATVSQTPVHELLGQFVNLSAEALEAARASHQAAIEENRTMFGEGWEQALNLAGELMGANVEPTASAVWRDTRVRSLPDAAAGLGLLVEKLGVPARALWSRIPGVPQHERAQWEALAEEGDSFDDLAALLDRQAASGEDD